MSLHPSRTGAPSVAFWRSLQLYARTYLNVDGSICVMLPVLSRTTLELCSALDVSHLDILPRNAKANLLVETVLELMR